MEIAVYIIAACEFIRLIQNGIQLWQNKKHEAVQKRILKSYDNFDKSEADFFEDLRKMRKVEHED